MMCSRNWDWTHLGARDKTWSLAISGHPSSSANPRTLYSIALEQKEQWLWRSNVYPLCTCVFQRQMPRVNEQICACCYLYNHAYCEKKINKLSFFLSFFLSLKFSSCTPFKSCCTCVSFSEDEFVIGPCRSTATHDNDRK
jgi:hypothetical protein